MDAFKYSALLQRLKNTLHYRRCFQILCTTTDAFKYCALPQMLLNTVHYCRGFQILCTTAEAFKGCALPKRLNNLASASNTGGTAPQSVQHQNTILQAENCPLLSCQQIQPCEKVWDKDWYLWLQRPRRGGREGRARTDAGGDSCWAAPAGSPWRPGSCSWATWRGPWWSWIPAGRCCWCRTGESPRTARTRCSPPPCRVSTEIHEELEETMESLQKAKWP